ncbi:MAG: hypothetical protein U0W65_15495 [Bacteroidia bacterium]
MSMIPEKYVEPSNESIVWIKKQVTVHDFISKCTKHIILFYIPLLILFYKSTTLTQFVAMISGLLFLCGVWVYSTRKRNHLNIHLKLQIWLFDLMQYPDKVQHDKYLKPEG